MRVASLLTCQDRRSICFIDQSPPGNFSSQSSLIVNAIFSGGGGHLREAFKMYLAGLVSSTFVMARRPASNVELVELSLENEYLPPKLVERHKEFRRDPNGHLNGNLICNYGDSNQTKAITEVKNVNTSIVPATPNRKLKERRKRRISLEDLPADLYMEPLNPLLLQLPEGGGGAATLGADDHQHRVRSSAPGGTSACVLRKLGLEEQDLDQEWSFWMSNMAQADRTMAETNTESSVATVSTTSKVGSPLLLSRVHHHPLEVTEEVQEHRLSDADARTTTTGIGPAESFRESCEEMKRDITRVASLPRGDEAFARILQVLKRIEESESAKGRKSSTRIGAGEIAPRLSDEHAGLDALEPDDRKEVNPGEQGASIGMSSADAEALGDIRRPTLSPMPSLSSPVMEKSSLPPLSPVPSLFCPMLERSSPSVSSPATERSPSRPLSPNPSFSSPMMEKMQAGAASPELLHSWNETIQSPPKVAVRSMEPVREETVLWYSSPRRTEEDIQADPSFRRWRWKPPPEREPTSDFEDFQELDIGAPADGAKMRDQKYAPTNFTNFEAFLNLRTFDLGQKTASAKVDSDARNREDGSHSDYPSPSSFTCRLSPTSLFSVDQEPFHLSLSPFDDKFAYFPQAHKIASEISVSPRSVLSQEPKEVSHFLSHDSEMRKKNRAPRDSSCELNNYESSDLETPRKTGFGELPFPPFTYNVADELGETSSEEDLDDACEVTTLADTYQQHSSSPELHYFQEAEQREPWLDELDDADLEFLFPLDFSNKYRNMIRAVPKVSEEVWDMRNPNIAQGNPRKPTEDIVTTVPEVRKEVSEMASSKKAQGSPRNTTKDIVTTVSEVRKEDSEVGSMKTPQETPKNRNAWVPYVTSQLHESYSSLGTPTKRGMTTPRRLSFQEKSSEVFVASLYRGISLEKQSPVQPKAAPKRRVNFAPDLVREIPISASNLSTRKPKPPPLPLPLRRASEEVDHESIPPNPRDWKVEEDSPSILTSRRRWGSSFRDETASISPGKPIQAGWGFGEGLKSSRRGKGGQAMPFCAGRLFTWPQRFGLKASKSRRPTDSSDEESVAGDGHSFGRSARRDADTVRKILKGSQKKYASLTIADILKQDF
ncbi:uncharacterized protein [Physcomitrium patens]|uniref:Uncharacterized protein n=2 Tax=Physcomitrium patens TaxID=3218 RepID=A0A7I4FHX7_PHYPA|nr:uncharacterized protein LOC112277323 isoform X1 [Physcomitrium patens]|eukprot:XP_024365243.1 uncharacterized protein LOC112277323 isoform X1 [Physcomitrella patens]